MNATRILIVEDEILIADTIARYLTGQGYQVVDVAISYEEAEQAYLRQEPDLALLDIRLNGSRTGVDFAHFLRKQPRPIPFVYLTSQLDGRSLDLAKETFPAGYLSKPIHKESLYTTIEIALHAHAAQVQAAPNVTLYDGVMYHQAPLCDILYLEADHVYVRVHITGGDKIVLRRSLSDLMEEFPDHYFVQTHRGFAVNLRRVGRWDAQRVYIGDQAIPLSRSRRKEVLARLTRV